MIQKPKLKNGEAGFRQLIKMLASDDHELHEYATGRFIWATGRAGKEPILMALVMEATKPRRRVNHRLRILEVMETIGRPLGLAFFELGPLLEHRSPQLREKAFDVMTGGLFNPDAPQRRGVATPTGRQGEGETSADQT